MLHLGLALNARIHKVFLASTLSFIMQLEPDPPDLLDSFDYVTRRLAAGPGNWISRNDLYNLKAVNTIVLISLTSNNSVGVTEGFG